MATTPSQHHDTDLLIVGGGPAGCAAGVMAASVGTRSVLIEPDRLCGKLQHIPVVDNVLGGFTSGPGLAAVIAGDLGRSGLCQVELGRRATGLRVGEDHVAVTLDSGRRLTAPYVVVATGVGPLGTGDVSWVTAPEGLPTLWGGRIAGTAAGRLLVVGADRPLGTFLRAHPGMAADVLVAYPPEDDYKADEVRGDPRVTLLPAAHLEVRAAEGTSVTAELTGRNGDHDTLTTDIAFLNLGSAPTPPPGDLTRDALGYCPPGLQHSRVIVAGDLRSPRFQRIMTATGSGGEAALRAYYAAQDGIRR